MISNANDHEGVDHPASEAARKWILPEHTADDPLCSDETIPSSSSAVLYIMTGKELESDKDGDCLRYSSENTTPEDFTAKEAHQLSCCGTDASMVSVSRNISLPMEPVKEVPLKDVNDLNPAMTVECVIMVDEPVPTETTEEDMADLAEKPSLRDACITEISMSSASEVEEAGESTGNAAEGTVDTGAPVLSKDRGAAVVVGTDAARNVGLSGEPVEDIPPMNVEDVDAMKIVDKPVPTESIKEEKEEKEESVPSASEVEEAGESTVHAAEDAVRDEAPVLFQDLTAESSEEVSTDTAMLSASGNISLSKQSVEEIPSKDVDNVDAAVTDKVEGALPLEAKVKNKEWDLKFLTTAFPEQHRL